MFLVLDDRDEHVQDCSFDCLANPCETEHLLEDLVSHLLRRHLGVQNVLLEKGVLAVHVRTVEKSVAIDNIVHKACTSPNIVLVIVVFTLDIVLIAADIALFYRLSSRQRLSRSASCLKAKWAILPLSDFLNCCLVLLACSSSFLLVPSILVKGLLQLSKPFIEVDIDIGPTDLD